MSCLTEKGLPKDDPQFKEVWNWVVRGTAFAFVSRSRLHLRCIAELTIRDSARSLPSSRYRCSSSVTSSFLTLTCTFHPRRWRRLSARAYQHLCGKCQ